MIELTTSIGNKISIDLKRISAFKQEEGDIVNVYLDGDPVAFKISMTYEDFKALYFKACGHVFPDQESEQFASVYRKIAAVQETVGNMVEIMRGFENAALHHVHETCAGISGKPLLKTTQAPTLQDEDTNNG